MRQLQVSCQGYNTLSVELEHLSSEIQIRKTAFLLCATPLCAWRLLQGCKPRSTSPTDLVLFVDTTGIHHIYIYIYNIICGH